MIGRCVSHVTLSALLLWAGAGLSQDLGDWPKEIAVASGTITVYQPQVDSLEGDIVNARAAVAHAPAAGGDPVFGATWLRSQVEIDRDARIVRYVTIEVADIRFPEGNEVIGRELEAAVRDGMTHWHPTSTLDDLTTSLAAGSEAREAAARLNVAPPRIIYRDEPAILVTIDGKEQLQEIQGARYRTVVNTPYPIVESMADKTWHLNAASGVWYRAESLDGPWTFDAGPPADLVAMVGQQAGGDAGEAAQEQEPVTAANAPEIVVAHEPAELVVSEGKAEFKPLVGNLLAMSNTDSSLFMDVGGQMYYLVVGGRWYRAKALPGPWKYVKSDALPASFAEIPEDSDYADVRTYVAGTDEAQEAVLDAQIPQTAAVERGPVDLTVTYDGDPQFAKVDGTALAYAVNTPDVVIKSGRSYYMVVDAVWYISGSPNGPWVVSDHAPPGIEKAEPTSPVYNTKYVYVYDATPEVVYVGYTPGYTCSYVYGPTIVYGTGWYYRPWISPVCYYPRPRTWGFSVSYNPWTGWGFGLSWNSGPFHFGWCSGGGWHRGRPWYGPRGWWGPGGYRPGFGNIRMNKVSIRNTVNINAPQYRNNLYASTRQAAAIHSTRDIRAIDRPKVATAEDLRRKATDLGTSRADNNVFVDRSGKIYRQQDGTWQKNINGRWQPVSKLPADRPSTRPVVTPTRPATRPTAPGATQPPAQSQPGVARPATRPGQEVTRPAAPTTRPVPRPATPVTAPAPRPVTPTPAVTRPAPKPVTPAVAKPTVVQPAPRPTSAAARPTGGYKQPSSLARQQHARTRSVARAGRR